MLTLRLLWVVLLIVMLPQHSCTEVGSPIHKLPLRLSNNYVYYATLGFGSKGQRIEVQLDTGSSTLAVFCDICKDKCVVDQEFMTSLSSSFKNITCAAAKVLAKSLKTTPQAL